MTRKKLRKQKTILSGLIKRKKKKEKTSSLHFFKNLRQTRQRHSSTSSQECSSTQMLGYHTLQIPDYGNTKTSMAGHSLQLPLALEHRRHLTVSTMASGRLGTKDSTMARLWTGHLVTSPCIPQTTWTKSMTIIQGKQWGDRSWRDRSLSKEAKSCGQHSGHMYDNRSWPNPKWVLTYQHMTSREQEQHTILLQEA